MLLYLRTNFESGNLLGGRGYFFVVNSLRLQNKLPLAQNRYFTVVSLLIILKFTCTLMHSGGLRIVGDVMHV
jgi:hypothetical protein